MRKITVLLMAALLVLGLAACGDGTEGTSSAPVVESSEPSSSVSATTSSTATSSTATTLPPSTTTSRTVTKATTSATATTTTVMMTEREKYLSQVKITHVGSPDDEKGWVYQLGLVGVMVREATIDSGRGGDPVEIVQITDLHFNYLNDQDFKEKNPTVMSTYENRTHMANGASRKNAEACMYYGSFFDQTVVTGDTIDYLTWGALEMVKEIIWDPYPTALVALGNHDHTREVGSATKVDDPTTQASRDAILQKNWKHDIYYTSKVLKNKAMVIQMDNATYDGEQYIFHAEQLRKLKEDLEIARSKGYVVLLFVHVPLATNNPDETKVAEIARIPKNYNNFYVGANPYVAGGKTSTGVTREVWDLIMNSADVIRGVFAGHIHEDYYTEMLAKTPSGEDKIIPQYVNHAAFSDKGHVLKITVK